MRNITYSGTLTARSSIAHGGQSSGATHRFRRESIVQDDGTLLAGVPVVSGSVIRGALRRHAATMTQAAIMDLYGVETLPSMVVHALRTGGSLRQKRASEEAITGNKQAVLRDVLPMLGVFGVTVGSRIIAGRLLVDKAVPLARETAHLAPYYGVTLDGYTPPSVWELIQRETYARQADVTSGTITHLLSDADDIELPKAGGQMQYAHETLPMGTRLLHSIHLAAATPLEQSFTAELLDTWNARARIGGQHARGLGNVMTAYTREVTTITGAPAPVEHVDWRAYMAQHIDDLDVILAAL